jgi:hypothetical protein
MTTRIYRMYALGPLFWFRVAVENPSGCFLFRFIWYTGRVAVEGQKL